MLSTAKHVNLTFTNNVAWRHQEHNSVFREKQPGYLIKNIHVCQHAVLLIVMSDFCLADVHTM